MSDYERIARAIEFLNNHVQEQPSLSAVAAHVHLSPFHFQRLFSRWAGTTPKRFLQVLTLELGKQLLDASASLPEATDIAGLSSGSRLHDHFVQLEAVTPAEYRNRGAGLELRYGCAQTPFGTIFVACTPRGICRLTFLDPPGHDLTDELQHLQLDWPLANLTADTDIAQPLAATLAGTLPVKPLPLHVRGTNFQIAVWRALLRIPAGMAFSYADIATAIGKPAAVRAAGSAIGANPVAFLIPCHRVIRQSGALGGYRWGLVRKQALQIREILRQGHTGPLLP